MNQYQILQFINTLQFNKFKTLESPKLFKHKWYNLIYFEGNNVFGYIDTINNIIQADNTEIFCEYNKTKYKEYIIFKNKNKIIKKLLFLGTDRGLEKSKDNNFLLNIDKFIYY